MAFSEICRTCSLMIKNNLFTMGLDSNKLNSKEMALRNELYFCCPELDLRVHQMIILCNDCFEITKTINDFYKLVNKSKVQFNEDSIFAFHSKQYSTKFDCYNVPFNCKIKTEELVLSDAEDFTDTNQFDSLVTIKEATKYNSEIDIFKDNYICIHTGKKLFKCLECGYTTARKYDLKIHTRIHTKEKPFKCPMCDHTASRKCDLKRHIRIHTRDKPYKCPECNYNTTQKHNLKIHTRIRTGEKSFKCSECDYSCTSSTHLKLHIRSHMEEKPYICLKCGYGAIQKTTLINHIRIHTGEKPFKCSYCDFSTAQNVNLKNHIRIHTGEKPFNCLKCSYGAIQKTSLINHIRIHTGEKPFKC